MMHLGEGEVVRGLDCGVVGSHYAGFGGGVHYCGEEADDEEDGEAFG